MTPPRKTRASRRSRPLRLAAVGIALAVLAAGCVTQQGSDDETSTIGPEPDAVEEPSADPPDLGEDAVEPAPEPPPIASSEPPPGTSLIATAQVPVVDVVDRPAGTTVAHSLEHPREVGAPLTFLVDDRDGDWLEVLLPVRPNGTTGWIHTDDVALSQTPYRIEVELSTFQLTVHEHDEVRLEAPIGVGGDGTPTPPGRYYVTELLRPPDPTGPYGPYAFGLSGFSEVHLDFAGGEGVIGIHGTNDPSSIGRNSSNGCIRLHNDVVTELSTFVPLGTPVEIVA